LHGCLKTTNRYYCRCFLATGNCKWYH